MSERPIRYRILGRITAEPASIATLALLVEKSESSVHAALKQLKGEGVEIRRDWYGEAKEYRYTVHKGMDR